LSAHNRTIAQLLSDLEASRLRVSAQLRSVHANQDWQPDPNEWSFRYIAAHMAQVELDAVLARAQAIAANTTPHYTYYYNTGWDFSGFDLKDSLDLWAARRAELSDLVQSLLPEQLTYTGSHDYFGVLTVSRVLEIALEHDGEHELDMQQKLAMISE